MSFKKFGVCSLVIVIIVAISSLVLGFVSSSTPLNQEQPSAFYVYDHSSVAKEITKETDEEQFNKLCNALSNLTKINLASRLIQGGRLDEQPSQDIDQVFGEVSLETIKYNHKVIEVVWENKQQQIVSINGNEKVLEYYSCVFAIDETKPKILAIALSQSLPTASKKVYNGSPMLVRGSTAELYAILENN